MALLLVVQASWLTSCNDDMAAENYYTFTGEMMSDFLNNREDFSLFRRIVERSGNMSLLSARGTSTFFPATNAGVETFLAEMGYGSVEDIPEVYCDTLVKASFIEDRVLYTYNMEAVQQIDNALELPLIITTSDTLVDEDGVPLSVINGRARIINSMKNDSVDNGVVHPVDQVIVPNTTIGSTFLEQNSADFKIYFEALRRTNLVEALGEFRDVAYEEWKNDYPQFRTGIKSGGVFDESQIGTGGYDYMARRPDHLDAGFTVFVVPDDVLFKKYPQYFSESNTLDENLEGLYELAKAKYNDQASAEIFRLDDIDPRTGLTNKEACWNTDSLQSPYNPLHIFMSYHILDRLFESTNIMVNAYGVNYYHAATAANDRSELANPTEWVGTLQDFSLLKIEKVYRTVDTQVERNGDFYLNHCTGMEASDNPSGEYRRGAHVTQPDNNFSINCAYYYLDDVIAYDADTRDNVMNTRIRMDMSTIWPELTNNGIRLSGDIRQPYDAALDNTESTENYYIPSGYLKNTEVSENTIFFVQRPKLPWWNVGGDEFNFLGSSYDITFRLPNVPPGQTYEVRMGYAGMLDRGIAQIYLGVDDEDPEPVGIPVDLRYQGSDPAVGGIFGANLNDEEWDENVQTMKNNGYYRGPTTLYTYGGTVTNLTGPDVTGSAASQSFMYDNAYTYRRKLCDVTPQPGHHNTLRIRSVWVAGNSGCFMIDYIELVPHTICGVGGLGENDK